MFRSFRRTQQEPDDDPSPGHKGARVMKRPTRQESRPVSQATELPYRFLPFFRSGRCQNGRSRWTKSLKLRKTLHVADYGGACRKVFTKSCSRHQHLAAIEAQDVAFPGLEQAPAPHAPLMAWKILASGRAMFSQNRTRWFALAGEPSPGIQARAAFRSVLLVSDRGSGRL